MPPPATSPPGGADRGPSFLDGLDGDVAVIVADAGRGVLAGAVTAGPHRVWCRRDGDAVSLATHSTLLGAGLAADRRHEDFLLAHGFVPEGASVFAGVHALAPGAVTTFPDGARHPIAGPAAPALAHDTDPAHWPKQLHELLLTAVEARAGTAREHAVFLGGFDSTLVAALLVGLGHRVRTYTFGFEDRAVRAAERRRRLPVPAVRAPVGADHLRRHRRRSRRVRRRLQPAGEPAALSAPHPRRGARRRAPTASTACSPATAATRRSSGSRRCTGGPRASPR